MKPGSGRPILSRRWSLGGGIVPNVGQGNESRTLLRVTALYKGALELGFVLLPLALVGYLYYFQSLPQTWHHHLFHELAISVSILLSLFAAWVSFRCFLASGEPSLRYITLAFLGFAVVYAPHGVLTRMGDHNIWLFVLYGPASRVVMTAFLLEALLRHGEAPEPVRRRRDPTTWIGWLVAVVLVDGAVAALSTLPVAGDPRIRLTMEGLSIALALGGVAAIHWRRLASGLMWAYRAALLAFAISSFTFLLTPAWTHLWWLAHAIFAGGFFILSHGLARALLTTRSIANVHSEEEMIARIAGAEAAAAASRPAEARLRLLLENSPVGVMVTAPDGTILFCNRSHADILGLAPEQVLGRDATAFHADPNLRREKVAEALACNRTVSGEVQCVPATGEPRWYMVTWSPIEFEGRQALVAWAVDVTERHAAAEALLQAKQAAELANRAKTEFLAAISHELRTPLNAINGFAESMQAEILGPLGNGRYREYCGHIVEAGHHLTGLINDVLDVARVESGRVPLREERVRVAALVRAAVVMVGDRARAAQLKVGDTLPADLPDLRGDPLRLKQVLLNLLANAVKFTPEGGRVTVHGRVNGQGGIELVIEDTGIGISPQDHDRVMAAFGQADSGLERRYQGLGLGLPLARSLMELHGGGLAIDSRPGEGTRVRLSFPAARTLAAGDDDEDEVRPLSGSAAG